MSGMRSPEVDARHGLATRDDLQHENLGAPHRFLTLDLFAYPTLYRGIFALPVA